MKYTIEITEAAQRDFESIYLYISDNLCNKQAASRLISLMDKNIKSLADMPERFPLVNDEYLRGLGIRCITVKNYIVFYMVDISEQKVFVVRVLYGRRNWIDILGNDI